MAQRHNYYLSVFFQLQVLKKKCVDFTVTDCSVKQRICAMYPGGKVAH